MTYPHPGQSRIEGVPAVEVELADGNIWGLALPCPRLRSVTRRDVDPFGRPRVRIELVSRFGYPIFVQRHWDEVLAALRHDDSRPRKAFRRLAVALLRMAHEIEPDEAETLLDLGRADLERVAAMFIPAAFGEADPERPDGR